MSANWLYVYHKRYRFWLRLLQDEVMADNNARVDADSADKAA